jgi:uncharacterized protein DUF6687
MQYLPYARAGAVPNIIVDGAATTRTVLTLSHWPKSGTPAELKADTSAEIVFRYLGTLRLHVDAEAVSNNHFDEDGLIGIFAIVQPAIAGEYRDLLIDAARAGDFGVYTRRDAARLAFAISAASHPGTSPVPAAVFDLPYGEMAGELYTRLLDLLPRCLTDLDGFRHLWAAQDEALAESERLIDRGLVTIDEHRDLDLAIVSIPGDAPENAGHPMAINSRTPCSRIALVRGQHIELQYRYEGWVQLASRRPAPRVDLAPLADDLNRREESEGRWVFDGVDAITPALHLEGSPDTTIPADQVLHAIERHLETAPAAWDPYD